VLIVVYFVIDSVRKLLDNPWQFLCTADKLSCCSHVGYRQQTFFRWKCNRNCF